MSQISYHNGEAIRAFPTLSTWGMYAYYTGSKKIAGGGLIRRGAMFRENTLILEVGLTGMLILIEHLVFELGYILPAKCSAVVAVPWFVIESFFVHHSFDRTTVVPSLVSLNPFLFSDEFSALVIPRRIF